MFQIAVSTPNGEQVIDLKKDCYRLGKASDIVLPVSADHCATVYRRNGHFHFSNRSTGECSVARQAVQQGESVVWAPGKRVDIGHGVTLQLRSIRQDGRNIGAMLSPAAVQNALQFNRNETQVVDDKIVALLCGGLLFFSLIKFLDAIT